MSIKTSTKTAATEVGGQTQVQLISLLKGNWFEEKSLHKKYCLLLDGDWCICTKDAEANFQYLQKDIILSAGQQMIQYIHQGVSTAQLLS